MTIFMLHFDCHPSNNPSSTRGMTADACVIGDTLEKAEAVARDAIHAHDYNVGSLIAFSQLDEAKVAELANYEAALYLKAVQHKNQVAVVFS